MRLQGTRRSGWSLSTPGAMLGAIALVAAASAGCSATHVHSGMATSISAPEKVTPLRIDHGLSEPYRVIALAVETAEKALGPPADHEYKSSFPFDLELLEERLAGLLEESGGFSRVIRINGEEGEEIPISARKQGAGLLLQVDLERAYLTHVGGTPGATWCTLIWIFGGWATHWWHDQIFEMNFHPRVRITDLTTGREVCTKALPGISREEALSFHERSSGVGTYLLTLIWPPGLTGADPDTVMESMLSAAGPDVGQPLAELLSRLYLPEVIRINFPKGEDLPVGFSFKNPVDGAVATKDVGLDVKLALKGSLKDLVMVKVNDEILWDASKNENIPPTETISFQKEKLPLVMGKATLEVSLRSAKEPIRAEVTRASEVRIR